MDIFDVKDQAMDALDQIEKRHNSALGQEFTIDTMSQQLDFNHNNFDSQLTAGQLLMMQGGGGKPAKFAATTKLANFVNQKQQPFD